MITQTLAILVDAYRELQAKKMFWIVMILNLLVVALFGLLGVRDNKFTFLWYASPNVSNALFTYKNIFSQGVVGFWFTWVAVILALISTAGIFPDFLSSGSVDLFIARPIGRLRLFLTKYFAGMLFVGLQVAVFALACFLVLGIRASLWQPGIFLAIPLVLLLFSYLFAVMVFFGVLTRSTLAALFLALLAWAVIGGTDTVDNQLIQARLMYEQMAAQADAGLQMVDHQANKLRAQMGAASQPGAETQPDLSRQLEELQTQRRQLEQERDQATWSPTAVRFENALYAIKTMLPKTRETTNLMDRSLFSDTELEEASEAQQAKLPAAAATQAQGFRRNIQARTTATEERVELERHRPLWWVLGTSLLFEAAFLALAAWIFCRRDY